MTGTDREAPPRRDGAAQRAARPRPDALGGRGAQRASGEVEVASGRKPRLRGADGVPGVRGVVRLGEAMAVIPLVKRALPEARLPFQDASVLGVAAGASLTGALARRRLRGVGGESVAALVSVAPALFALRGGELAAYHGVEHKAIAAYEQDDRGRQRRLQGARALRLAPRRADARLQPGRHAAAAPRAREAGPDGGRRGRARLHRGRRRGVRVVRAQRRDARSPARCGGPGFEIQRAGRHARARRAPARGRPRRAGRDPARRRPRTKVHAALWRARRLR